MHAIVVNVDIKSDDAVGMLHSQIVPTVKAQPGFVAGYWTRSADGTKGVSMSVYESEAAARDALQTLQGDPPPPEAPVSVASAEIYEILASA
jgi:hypothetical protein